MRTFFRQLLLAAILFEAVVVGGLALFMGIGMIFGYLPHSDRPGPGWHEPSQTVSSLPIVWEWLSLNPWTPPIIGAVICVLLKAVLIVPRAPFAMVRVVGALLAGSAAVLWVVATGWYFALSLSVQWAGLTFGIICGGWVLPRILHNRPWVAQRAAVANR